MKISKKLFLFLLMLNIPLSLQAQYLEKSGQSGVGSPYFDIMVQNQFNAEDFSYKLLILSQFLNDDLTFIKSDTSGYDGEIELVFAVYDESENVVSSKSVNKKLNVANYGQTNTREKKYTVKTELDVKAGQYVLLARSTDRNSGKSVQRKVSLNLTEFQGDEVRIGGVLFLQDVKFDSVGRVLDMTPTAGNNFTARKGDIYIYFDLYVNEVPGRVDIQYELEDEEADVEMDTLVSEYIDTKVSSHLLTINRGKLQKNKYKLRITATAGEYSREKTQAFSFYWSDVPSTDGDIDKALQQMSYIVNPDSLEKYLEMDLMAKKEYFDRFWDERDPDPKTSINELKDEYFKRINFCDRNFGAFGQDGWSTDRGRILIKFGYPDDIERHPFEMGRKPYEIWRYYAARKVFVFEDRTGFGDYRLHLDYLDMEFQ